jgi:excinuclease UvrABC nuclease subunit
VVRQVSWTRVDSVFEQDVVYTEVARQTFPESYAGVLGFANAWWLNIDAQAALPRVARTTEPCQTSGEIFGPIPDKNAAQKLAHAVEDLFDLCRDPAALAAAPAGPCQWRQMGKCVGPCDGSVSLPAYRALVAHAAEVVGGIDRAVEETRLRMRQAAAALEFEAAGAIKAFLEKLEVLRQGPFRHLRRLEDFRSLAVMPGRRRGTAKLFAITPGRIVPLACLCEAPAKGRGEEVLRLALEAVHHEAVLQRGGGAGAAERERLSLVAHHLFPTRRTPGVFIHAAALEDRTLGAAFREVNRPKVEAAPDEEGEVRGIQAT